MIRVTAEPFDPGLETTRFIAGLPPGAVGGIGSFLGLVRGDGDRVRAMSLEHYPGMTERMLAAITAEAEARWPLDATMILHRVGRLVPGDPVVLVMTASAHRIAALDACAFLIDWLKTKAPFWKSEETDDGQVWVAAKASDDQAADRWK